MTTPCDHFAPNDCARAFMRTAQYMASILPEANVLAEAGQIIRVAFALDTVTFLPYGSIGDLAALGEVATETQATILGMARQVLDSGFMATETTSAQRPAVWIALPVTVRCRTEAVMLVSYGGENEPPHHLLESLLGVAALVSSTLKHQLAYHELRDSGIQTLQILDAIGDGVCRVDTAGIITFANKAALDILGGTEQQLIGVPFVDFAFSKEDLAAAQGCAGGRHDAILRRLDGTTFPAELICIPIFSIGQTAGAVATFTDISDRKAKAVLSKMAYYDPLTQLPNRRLLADRLSMAIASGRRRRLRLAVIFLDLDLFKQINDTLGHDAGDQVLIEVAHRLCQCVREGDTVSRLGGDEFVILQVELEDQTDAACLAERVTASIKQTMQVSGYELNVTASIGIALYPEDGIDPDTLLKCSDNAMYRAKNAGRGLDPSSSSRGQVASNLGVASMNENGTTNEVIPKSPDGSPDF